MACRAIHRWTLCSLVGAYIDIALVYLFLCGSTFAFLASKFLSLFDLDLPCPCNGLFGHPNPRCIQGLLVDYPTTKIAYLRTSILTKFPFNSIRDVDRGILEFGRDESCGSVSNSGPSPIGLEFLSSSPRALDGLKGKGILRRRRRASLSRRGKSPSVSCSATSRCGWQGEDETSAPVDSGSSRYLLDEVPLATECSAAEASADVHGCVKNLEEELEEAQAAHAALYLELEKERSAAATAAEEAMAMILRLQSEKAAIEMEARQYQRMTVEKSAYDEEEMEILKEIIVKREREKHVLEKELEAYRQLKPESSFNSPDDPVLMLQTISAPIGNKDKVKDEMQWVDDSGSLTAERERAHVVDANWTPSSTAKRYLELADLRDECNLEFQEKGVLEVYPSSAQSRSCNNVPQEPGFHTETSSLTGQEDGRSDDKIDIRVPFDDLCRENVQDAGQTCSDSSQFESESNVLDVHVIDDEHDLGDKGTENNVSGSGDSKHESSEANFGDLSSKNPFTSWVGGERDVQRSYSDMIKQELLMGNSPEINSVFDLRRSSMSAIDSERLKLEAEVELLRKRLNLIQQGREKLTFSLENRERETFQLQLLEDISCQLQEIRKITETGESIRPASLPPQSSKVNTKKRRCRSVSWGLCSGST